VVGVIERFDPERVPGEGEAFFPGIPDGKGKHAVEAGKAVDSVLRPRLEENFRVRLGAKGGSTCLQIPAKFQIVVDLPVKNNVPASIGRGHGLGATGKIQDAESPMSQVDGGIGVRAFRIWTTVL